MNFLKYSKTQINVFLFLIFALFLSNVFFKNSLQSSNQASQIEFEEYHLDVQKKIKVSSPKIYKYDLSIVAIFHNEGSFLKEWIEFHRLVGVQHFYLYNNLSTDNFYDVLAPYLQSGEVDLIDWPYEYPHGNLKLWGQIQLNSYNHAINHVKEETKWLAIIDIDEFLVPVQNENLVQLLSDYENDKVGGLCVNWQMYGTSFVPKIPENKLLIEMLVLKADANSSVNTHVKTIVRPERVLKPNIHRCSYQTPFVGINSNGEVTKGSHQEVLIDKILINHYWTRDQDYFMNIKIPSRKKRGRGVDVEFYEKNYNQQYDFIMSKFVPKLRKIMGFEE